MISEVANARSVALTFINPDHSSPSFVIGATPPRAIRRELDIHLGGPYWKGRITKLELSYHISASFFCFFLREYASQRNTNTIINAPDCMRCHFYYIEWISAPKVMSVFINLVQTQEIL